MADGGDRGTFETAVGLDYVFFGIYGQAMTQSFAFKTEMAGMALGLTNDSYGKLLQDQHEERLSKGQSGYDQEIAAHEETKKKAALILERLRIPESRDGERSAVEPLLEQIEAHRRNRFDLGAELRKEEAARQNQRDLEAQAQQKKKDKIKKIATVTVSILIVLDVLLLILL